MARSWPLRAKSMFLAAADLADQRNETASWTAEARLATPSCGPASRACCFGQRPPPQDGSEGRGLLTQRTAQTGTRGTRRSTARVGA